MSNPIAYIYDSEGNTITVDFGRPETLEGVDLVALRQDAGRHGDVELVETITAHLGDGYLDSTHCELCGEATTTPIETRFGDACPACAELARRESRGFNPTTGWAER